MSTTETKVNIEELITALRLAQEELQHHFLKHAQEAFVHKQIACKSVALVAVEVALRNVGSIYFKAEGSHSNG